MLEKLSNFVVKNPLIVIITILILTISLSFGIKNLEFKNKLTEWLDKDDPVLKDFIDVSKKFSINDLVLILIKPEDGAFNKSNLEKVKLLTEELKEKPEIFSVLSISNISDIRKIEDGIEVNDLLYEIPETKSKIKSLKRYVLSKEFYLGNVISRDGKWISISVFIDEKADPIKTVEKVIIPTTRKYFSNSNTKVYFSGMPSDGYYLNKYTIRDLMYLTPSIIILLMLTLFISFKGTKGVVYPSLVVILSNVWVFGIMGYLKKPLTLVSPAIPVLLVALGSAYGIHVFNKITHEIDCSDSLKKQKSLIYSTSEIMIPVFLAGLTTIVGFLSFSSAKLSLITDFGIFSALGILFALVISVTLIPALSSISKFKDKERVSKTETYKGLSFLKPLIIKHKGKTAIFSIILTIAFVLGIFHVKREVNFQEYYPKNSIPKKGLDIVRAHFDGAYPLYFYIKSDNTKSPETLRFMRRAENYLLSIDKTAIPFSIVDLILKLNKNLNDTYSIPEKKNEISNLWLFVEGRDELKNIISDDEKETIIFSKTAESTTSYNIKTSKLLDEFVENEINKSFYYYELSNLKENQKEKIRNLEAKLLTDEALWIFKRYEKKIPDKIKVFSAFTNPIDKKLLDSRTKRMFIDDIKKYIFSDEFDFEINEQRKELLLNKIKNQLDKNSLNKDLILKILKETIPSAEYDDEIASDVSETIIYKLNDSEIRAKAKIIHKRLLALSKSVSEPLKDRLFAISMDYCDNSAILKTPSIGNIEGKKLQIKKAFQSGIPAISTRLDKFLFSSQIQSLLIAYFLTLSLMILMRKSFSLGLISTIPIIFTVSLMYGALGFIGISLDYATMMIGGISIGVGIDYAIHFIHGYLKERDSGKSKEESAILSLSEKGKAILTNALSVIFGFFVLLFSSVLPLRNFGGTMVGAMLLSSFSALTILPVFIIILDKKLKEDKK